MRDLPSGRKRWRTVTRSCGSPAACGRPAAAEAALGLAPVALPKTPRIDVFWAFQEEGWGTPACRGSAVRVLGSR